MFLSRRWISVAKRMPQDELYVWVLDGGGVDMAVGARWDGEVSFRGFTVSAEDNAEFQHVTHWMPIKVPSAKHS